MSREHKFIDVKGSFTLNELGISIDHDIFGLSNSPLTLAEICNLDPQARSYLAIIHYPFAGEHLAHFLHTSSPNNYPGKDGIVNDLRMPFAALNAKKEGVQPSNERFDPQTLHRKHLEDPRIGEAYRSFIRDTARPLLKALGRNRSDSVFLQAQAIRFVNGRQEFTERFREDALNATQSNLRSRELVIVEITAASRYQHGGPFFDSIANYLPKGQDYMLWSELNKLPMQKRHSLLNGFVSSLTHEQLWDFANASFGIYGQTVINLEDGGIVKRNKPLIVITGKEPGIEIRNFNEAVITNEYGVSTIVQPGYSSSFGLIEGHLTNSHFSPDYLARAINPVIGWKRYDNGDLGFLSLNDIQSQLTGHFGSSRWANLDLGKILLSNLSDNPKFKWAKQMGLQGSELLMPISGAQLIVWLSIPRHTSELLTSSQTTLSRLESAAH